jgi:hypothetical protein
MSREGKLLIGILVFMIVLFGLIAFGPHNGSVQAQGSGHQGKHVATATTTPVKDGLSFLNSITINGGTPGVITIYDIAASGCTGTPGSGTIAAIEAISATAPVTLFYDIKLTNGVCIVTAAATDLTLSYD